MAKFNLNLSDSTYAEVSEMAERLDISMADVVREAINLLRWVTGEISVDHYVLVRRDDHIVELVMPGLERLRGSSIRPSEAHQSGPSPHRPAGMGRGPSRGRAARGEESPPLESRPDLHRPG
jgi:hypothetical protein